MKQIFLGVLTVFFAMASQGRDFKIVSQEFMPIGGAGPDGKMAGVHYEIAMAVCEKLKLTCKTELMPRARGLDQLKTGEAQMIIGIAKNAETDAICNFPGGVTQVGYTFFVKKGQAGKYKKIEDFKGKTIGVHGGSATGKNLVEQNAKLGGALKVVEEATAETPARKLAGDRYGADAAIYYARAVGIYQAKKENLDIEPVAFDAFLQSHSMPMSKVSVPADEFEKIKKAIHEVMQTEKIKKLIAENDLQAHPDQK